MPPKYFSTRGHLLVCQGPNCQARGSVLLQKALWNHLERSSLAYYKRGGSVRLTESGCLGACSFGPTLCVYRHRNGALEEGWYAAVDFPLAVQIAGALHEEAALPGEGKYGPE
ncbi:(2Fe-2S) ferredoxin domain-containing protein [Deinococcus hopiensis]|uniref:(2Fe-2S) ferredoxin n=1 Tax=Deinococcus hopiensis KR-140 TaxID=695939 RepID=A0A1W1V7A4_9DEIO|nr:(2Fe-2S) ferredoxin domain-containing protein [Deinococcus hopiensis]SMB89309.1 (2Fe-2S) ferredoxin [Deinococcus hopiensis KR-140]